MFTNLQCGMKTSLAFATLVFGGLLANTSLAEPYIAQRAGMKCSACHTNMTGGGKRNAVGNGFAQGMAKEILATEFSPDWGNQISTGANFRTNFEYTTYQEPDTVDPETIDDENGFSISNGAVYFEYKLADSISFYLDQQVAPQGGRTREALIIYKLSDDAYFKAGRMYLPFGLRLQDDEAFIRERTGFNFNNSDIGGEIGYEPGPFSLSFAVSNGTQGSAENNSDKQYTFVGSYIQPNYRVGLSLANNASINGNTDTLVNVFGGLNIGKVSLLGEVNKIKNETTDSEVSQLVTFLSANYLLNNSTNLKFSYEFLDPNDDIDEDEKTRVSLLGEAFLSQFTQLRVGLRNLDGNQKSQTQRRTEFFTELHLFY